jgi:hypothetical protein
VQLVATVSMLAAPLADYSSGLKPIRKKGRLFQIKAGKHLNSLSAEQKQGT